MLIVVKCIHSVLFVLIKAIVHILQTFHTYSLKQASTQETQSLPP